MDTPGPKLCPNIASIKQRTTPPAIDQQSSHRSSRGGSPGFAPARYTSCVFSCIRLCTFPPEGRSSRLISLNPIHHIDCRHALQRAYPGPSPLRYTVTRTRLIPKPTFQPQASIVIPPRLNPACRWGYAGDPSSQFRVLRPQSLHWLLMRFLGQMLDPSLALFTLALGRLWVQGVTACHSLSAFG